MNTAIGGIKNASGRELLKMWDGKVGGGSRPFRRHLHSRFEIALIKKGEGVYVLKDGECRFKAGDIFVFPPNVFHCITDVSSDTLEYTNIHFEPYFPSDDPDLCYTYSPDFVNRISGDGELTDIFTAIRAEMENDLPQRELFVKSLINMFIVRLIRNYRFAETAAPSNLGAALMFIDKNYTSQITLDEISATVGLTPTYFSGRFKALYGVSPWEYIMGKRIEQAIRLLRADNGMNILDIALACGFNNTANFNKLFKKGTGMTPSQLRRVTDIIIH